MPKSLKDLYKYNKKSLLEDTDLNLLIDKHLIQQDVENKSQLMKGLHPSMVSKGIDCPYYLYLRLVGQVGNVHKEVFTAKSLNAVLIGDGIHRAYQRTLYEMGILEGVWQCQICKGNFWATSPKGNCPICGKIIAGWDDLIFKEVPINIGFVIGHGDGILNINNKRIWLEIKSIKNVEHKSATYGFETLTNAPMDEHFIQAQLYLDCWYYMTKEAAKFADTNNSIEVDDDGRLHIKKQTDPTMYGANLIGPVNYAVILYVAKNTSEKRAFLFKRNRNSIKFIMNEIKQIWKAFLEGDPSNLAKLKDTDPKKCKKCRFMELCK